MSFSCYLLYYFKHIYLKHISLNAVFLILSYNLFYAQIQLALLFVYHLSPNYPNSLFTLITPR